MFKRIEIGPPRRELFAEATPLGLVCLAIGCAALTPIAFGAHLTPAGLRTAAVYCLLFGAGGQFLSGVMSFANHNLYGGTLFTAFAFNWVVNWWVLDALARGIAPDAGIVLAAEVCFLIIFLAFTYGFGFYSLLLFLFLVDIDLLYMCRIAASVFATRALTVPIALCTVGLGALSLWIAFALLINPTAGRPVFRLAGPIFAARARLPFDASTRRALLATLYAHWQEHAFTPVPVAELERAVAGARTPARVAAELAYLAELGGVSLAPAEAGSAAGATARLTAAGIDFYEQAVLGKDSFA
ncbi:MAG: hypothetical protein ACM3O7_06640 [Acidobacteriota bacterium]